MWLFQEAITWIALALLVSGMVALDRSYRVRNGRRENAMAFTLREGCIRGLIVSLLLIPIVFLAMWLTG